MTLLEARACEARLAWLGRPTPIGVVVALRRLREVASEARRGRGVDPEEALRRLTRAKKAR